MKTLEELRNTPNLLVQGRIPYIPTAYSGIVEWSGFSGSVVFGFDENGMEHVSVSSFKIRKLPSWDDMCKLKDMFFRKDEMVVQIHPSEDQYVHGVQRLDENKLENVLHLWRPKNGDWSMLNEPEKWN